MTSTKEMKSYQSSFRNFCQKMNIAQELSVMKVSEAFFCHKCCFHKRLDGRDKKKKMKQAAIFSIQKCSM